MKDNPSCNPDWPDYDPPHDHWKRCASQFVQRCKYHLWVGGDESNPALKTLRTQGFSREILKKASVGINPEGRYRDRSYWGAPLAINRRTWIPRGFVLPWIGEDGIVRIYVRSSGSKDDRENADWREEVANTYAADMNGPHIGRTAPLFGLQWVDTSSPIVLVEQEFDALAIQDVAGDLCSAVATGYPEGGRRKQWRDLLSEAPIVLVAFDESDPGQEAAGAWLGALPNAHRWPTYISEKGARMRPGERPRNWVEGGIGAAASEG